MTDTFARRMKAFNRNLALTLPLPPSIGVLNPFAEGGTALHCADAFYDKFYSDTDRRWAILGINPGRFGGGITGVPFTDFKRLRDGCGIDTGGQSSHEPSSEFIYRMIDALGGPADFYRKFYINSVCPLGFVLEREGGRQINYNYYDSEALYAAVKPFIVDSIRRQIGLGLRTEVCFCLGKKNGVYLGRINDEHRFFDAVIELPHPRYIVQYRRKEMDDFIEEYRVKLCGVGNGFYHDAG